MNDRDQRRYERILRVQTFGSEYAGDFAPGGKAAAHFAHLGRLVGQIDAAKAAQNPALTTKETLLDALHEDLLNVSRTAQAIALVEPGFAVGYVLPSYPTEASHLTHADTVLNRLEDRPGDSPEALAVKASLRERFTSYEMPDDFVADLRADLDELRQANARNRGETQGGVENTATIGLLMSQGSAAIQHLDALMRNEFARQPERLRVWDSASRLERAPKHRKEEKVVPVAASA